MEAIFETIFDKAKVFCRDEADLVHMVSALKIAEKLIYLEGGDERIIMPAIIMHDVGWHLFPQDEELKIRGPTALKEVELNHAHEVESAKLAEKILTEVKYPEEEKKRIIEIIIGHDNRSRPISKEDMIVKDADRLSRYVPKCFDLFCLKFKFEPGEFVDFLKSNIEKWLFTDNARFFAREYLLKRRLGTPEVEFTEGVRSNLFKILIKLEGELVKTVRESLEEITIKAVKEKVYSVRRMIKLYLADYKYIETKELQQNEDFQSIAVQKVGEGGYIGIIDRETGRIVFHPNRRITNLPLKQLKENERSPEYLFGFWDWYSRACKGEEFFSYYQGKNEKDEVTDKFQYAVPLDIKNIKWSIIAAASYDEFFKSIDILNKEIVQSVSEISDQIGHLANKVEQRTKELAESNRGLQKEIAERKKVEEQLRNAEEKYRIQFEGALDAIFVADAETGILLDCNPAATRLVDREKSELVGQHQRMLHPPEDIEEGFSKTFKEHVEEKLGQTLETQVITKKDQIRDVAVKASLLEIRGKKVIQGIFRDITDRKRAEGELKRTHEKLLEASRKAGMAEVASGVLHNVGNVLNSINVSASYIQDKVLNSKATNLKKVADILAEHADDLGTFLTQDQRGKYVPVYLIEVARLIINEQADIAGKLRSLTKNVEHIKQIIKTQQGYARADDVEVFANVNDVVRDAIEINSAGLKRHGVKLTLDLPEMPEIRIDRQRVLQILINLLSNSKYALSESQKQEKLMTVRCCRHGKARLRVEVADNGIGIPQENLTKIFRHGFTTKEGGKGFGLHSSALTAKQMGGSLTVHSDGPGQGATFTLELPCRQEVAAEFTW